MKTFTARVLLTPGGTGGASKLHRSFAPLRVCDFFGALGGGAEL